MALVHRIDAQIAGLSLGIGLAPLGDPDLSCLRAIEHHPLRAISPAAPQVVDVGNRDVGQADARRVGEQLILALEDASYRRPRQSLVGSVDGC